MKGHIAFCPHFHQPHFQLHRTREEAMRYSYEPWLRLLNEAAQLPGFYINLHYSGPFLYWMRSEKSEFAPQLRRLIAGNKVGILGGLADEPFIQLSSRSDDVLYQMQEYDAICGEVLGVKAADWQGIHIVERECGEYMLYHLSQAARLLGAPPIFYLDAESFYGSHFTYPGGSEDYCLKHFGFRDPVAKTTYGHLPEELLYFPLRDELAGESFISVPVHSRHRYQLLKRQAFTGEDRVKVKPAHYLFYLKDAMSRAWELSHKMGRPMEPVALIFEDAEKFGQWSKDPEGDHWWMMEFFRLVEADEEISFTGLRRYVEQQGFYDSYPVGSSHSYPEWENWTAKRGIRGICFGDERLRRVVARLRRTEALQQGLEEGVIRRAALALPEELRGLTERSWLKSDERYRLVEKLLTDETPALQAAYKAINRVRHLVYQEDPKWASRHPSYGSSPYYDVNGLAYLELADRLLQKLYGQLTLDRLPSPLLQDWDMDGLEEVWVSKPRLSLSVDREGGCINYLHVIDSAYSEQESLQAAVLEKDILGNRSYNEILRHSTALVLSETDSSLRYEAYPEGGRRELCRNSMRCDIIVGGSDGHFHYVDDFGRGIYDIDAVEETENGVTVCMSHAVDGGDWGEVRLTKTFVIEQDMLTVNFAAQCEHQPEGAILTLCPQLVCTATPSDEVHFAPEAWLCFPEGDARLKLDILPHSGAEEERMPRELEWKGRVDYLYRVNSGSGASFYNRVRYTMSGGDIVRLGVEPAVRHYYIDMVFPEQSRLSYNSSGLMLRPAILFKDGRAEFTVTQSWQLDVKAEAERYGMRIPLIK